MSATYSTAAHLCCCGCGKEVVTPLSRAQWVLTFDGHVSLRPSIGNWTLPCRSHYVIDRRRVRWARSFSDAAIRSNREDDRRVLDEAIAKGSGRLRRVARWIRSWRMRFGSF